MFSFESFKLSLYFILLASFIYILVNNNRLWVVIFSFKLNNFYTLDDDNYLINAIDKEIILKSMEINEKFISYIFERSNVKKAITLYFICRDNLIFIDDKVSVKLENDIKLNKNDCFENCSLTIFETSKAYYFIYSTFSLILIFLYGKYYNDNFDALILSLSFSSIFLYLGTSKLIESKLYELATKFTELD